MDTINGKKQNIDNLKQSLDVENTDDTENLEKSTGVDHLDIYDIQEFGGLTNVDEHLIKEFHKSNYTARFAFALHYWEHN